MPARRRPKSPAAAPLDPVAQFSAGLRESAERERAEREQARLAIEAAEAEARRAAEHAEALATAQRDLTKAIEAVRAAKRAGSGTVAADAAWRTAKARVIELETGTPPEWATSPRANSVTVEEEEEEEP